VAHSLVFDMPVELSVEFMAIVGPDFTDTKRELFDDVINEIDCAGLGVFLVDFECPNTCCIINGGELKTAYLLSDFSYEKSGI
jgi:hypothetical protein